ncbi:TPA: hypothetical protein DEP96_01530 [Candidatus Uhrbacteria bacterium]|nr:hypothetical protein [Candidatus Uhrbacteria bacterium]
MATIHECSSNSGYSNNVIKTANDIADRYKDELKTQELPDGLITEIPSKGMWDNSGYPWRYLDVGEKKIELRFGEMPALWWDVMVEENGEIGRCCCSGQLITMTVNKQLFPNAVWEACLRRSCRSTPVIFFGTE